MKLKKNGRLWAAFFGIVAAVWASYFLSSEIFSERKSETITTVSVHGKPPLAVTDQDREYMRKAIHIMRQTGVVDKTGGPFGALIVKDGKILAACGNSVLKDHDPSAHAEVNAIREACRKLQTVDLNGAVMYTSCECCPMCYAAAYWARIGKIYYGASWNDYDDLFDDAKISQDMAKLYPDRHLVPQQLLRDEADKVWDEYRHEQSRVRY